MDDDEHQIGYKVLPRGTPVFTSDGEQLGTVSKVLDNVREHIFDGIVVATGDASGSSTRPRSGRSRTAA